MYDRYRHNSSIFLLEREILSCTTRRNRMKGMKVTQKTSLWISKISFDHTHATKLTETCKFRQTLFKFVRGNNKNTSPSFSFHSRWKTACLTREIQGKIRPLQLRNNNVSPDGSEPRGRRVWICHVRSHTAATYWKRTAGTLRVFPFDFSKGEEETVRFFCSRPSRSDRKVNGSEWKIDGQIIIVARGDEWKRWLVESLLPWAVFAVHRRLFADPERETCAA